MRSKSRRLVVSVVVVLCLHTTGIAHDLWLIPPAHAKVSEKLTARAISGNKFPLGDNTPDPEKFARRWVLLPDGKEEAVAAAGTEEKAGLLTFAAKKPGVYLIAVQTKPKIINLEAEAFNSYLVSDGLPQIYQLRAREKTLDKPGVERYSKSPKALVAIGDVQDGGPCKVMGLPLEIVPLKNPFSSKPGETLKVRVLFKNKPLTDAFLGWDFPGGTESPAGYVRANDKGEALIPIAQTGLITIRLTHMTRPREKDYEWESFWTTLTFRVPEKPHALLN